MPRHREQQNGRMRDSMMQVTFEVFGNLEGAGLQSKEKKHVLVRKVKKVKKSIDKSFGLW